MKPVMKGARRQERRERTLARLEKYLAGGVKLLSGLDRRKTYVGPTTEPFTQKDIDRITKEIEVLKERLGKV